MTILPTSTNPNEERSDAMVKVTMPVPAPTEPIIMNIQVGIYFVPNSSIFLRSWENKASFSLG